VGFQRGGRGFAHKAQSDFSLRRPTLRRSEARKKASAYSVRNDGGVGGALDFVQGKHAPRTEITEKKEEKERGRERLVGRANRDRRRRRG
jgi:hypothetical protein